MGKKYALALWGFLTLLLTGSCFYMGPFDPENEYAGDTIRVTGYVPVYGTADRKEISMIAPLRVEDPGKIYVYGRFLLVNEKRKGIHVFDNANPAQPVNLGFIRMLGNTEMAVKDGLLYADHMGSLVALSVNDFELIEEQGRLPLTQWNFGLPPPSGFSFECIDPEKGVVVAWKEEEILNPGCYATF
jgi:hypothetical protein